MDFMGLNQELCGTLENRLTDDDKIRLDILPMLKKQGLKTGKSVGPDRLGGQGPKILFLENFLQFFVSFFNGLWTLLQFPSYGNSQLLYSSSPTKYQPTVLNDYRSVAFTAIVIEVF